MSTVTGITEKVVVGLRSLTRSPGLPTDHEESWTVSCRRRSQHLGPMVGKGGRQSRRGEGAQPLEAECRVCAGTGCSYNSSIRRCGRRGTIGRDSCAGGSCRDRGERCSHLRVLAEVVCKLTRVQVSLAVRPRQQRRQGRVGGGR